MRVGQNLLQCLARFARAQQQKNAHLLLGARRRIHPRIIGRVVIGQLPDTEAHMPAP